MARRRAARPPRNRGLPARLAPGLLALLVAAGGGCGDGGAGPPDVPPELAPFVGIWDAISATLTNQANPDMSVDLVEEGVVFTLEITSRSRYIATTAGPGQPPEVETGGVEVLSGPDLLVIDPDDPDLPTDSLAFRFAGDTLTLETEDEFDFNQDGTDEPAFLRLILVRG